jgi:hypothetical protein
MSGKLKISIGSMILLMLVAGHAGAQTYSLMADGRMSSCDVFLYGPYQPFDVYVYLETPEEGAFAAEYKMSALPGHFTTAQYIAPFVSEAVAGSWHGSPGISAPFTSCQTGIVIIARLTFMAPDLTPGLYMLELHEDSGFLGIATCEAGHPLADGVVRFPFGYNTGCSA